MILSKKHFYLITITIIILDQAVKQIVSGLIPFAHKIVIIENMLSLTKIYNTGAAFSILDSQTSLLAIFSSIAAIAIFLYFKKRIQKAPFSFIAGWALVLGGTIGNLIDRIFLGHVIDFISLDFINFPIFNIADIAINVGAMFILFYIIKQPNETESENAK